jgi:hypothetical protein
MINNLSRRTFLNYVAGSAIAAALPGCAHDRDATSTSLASKPNIIFILADDLGYGDLACYGSPHIQTPNLDHLATQGLRFTNAYAGSTVCAPSRCCLMTGLHTGHAFIRGNHKQHRVDPANARQHVFDEVAVTGHIHDADLLAVGQRHPGEAQVDGHLALLFFLEAVGVSPG